MYHIGMVGGTNKGEKEMSYKEELNKLYNKNTVLFMVSVTHLLDIGFNRAQQIQDKDIESLKGNGIMTKQYVQDLVRLTREIANTVTPTELMQWMQTAELFSDGHERQDVYLMKKEVEEEIWDCIVRDFYPYNDEIIEEIDQIGIRGYLISVRNEEGDEIDENIQG